MNEAVGGNGGEKGVKRRERFDAEGRFAKWKESGRISTRFEAVLTQHGETRKTVRQ